MQTQVVQAGSEFLPRAIEVLRCGGLVAFPTDTVYGVGALAFAADAVARLSWAKERPSDKAIPVLLGQTDDLDQVAEAMPEVALMLARRFWPGPLTLVVRKRSSVPEAVAPGSTVGVRVPDHSVALALLRAAGPMAVTSANLSGQPSSQTADEVLAQLDGKIEIIVDGGATPGGIASTVLDCTERPPRILRPGPISLDEIMLALH